MYQGKYSNGVFERDIRAVPIYHAPVSELIRTFQVKFNSAIDISGQERFVSLHWLLLVEVCIYKHSAMSESSVLVNVAKAHFKTADWATGFKKW